jgi:hypothetical protein
MNRYQDIRAALPALRFPFSRITSRSPYPLQFSIGITDIFRYLIPHECAV